MSKKGKFLLGAAILAGLGAVAAVVTREIKAKKQQCEDEDQGQCDDNDEHMYKIGCHDNECFGYDSEEYNCKEEKANIIDEKDDYGDYSEN